MNHVKPAKGRLIRLPEVVTLTGYSKPTIYAYIRSGKFPAPVKLGSRASAWVESEIDEWIAARIEARDESLTGEQSAA